MKYLVLLIIKTLKTTDSSTMLAISDKIICMFKRPYKKLHRI